MKKRPYETADTLVYDPVASNRNATRASLHSLGFRRVDLAASLDILLDRLRTSTPDLLLLEVAGAENEVCQLVQSVRQGRVGANPFILVMATTWRRDGTIVNQVVNSGADDLVARPISTSLLGERIRSLVERRKPFVITSDYIGPDRRRDPGRNSAERLEVPNSLKIRSNDAIAGVDAERQIAAAIDEGKTRLNLEKIRRDSVTLGVQLRMLEQKTPGGRDFLDLLPRMEKLSEEIKRRLSGTMHDKAGVWCDSILDSVRTLSAVKEAAGSTVDFAPMIHLLRQSALSLGEMFAPGDLGRTDLVNLDQLPAASVSG
jgi:DNA-binding response OmpR family regulator